MNPTAGVEDASLTVEYALTRGEILKSFLRSTAASPKLRRTILAYAVAIGIVMSLFQAMLSQSFNARSLIAAILWTLGFLLFIALWVFVRGKTSKRTLKVSKDGISTQIGRISGTVSWSKVSGISSAPEFLLILRNNGNAFFVPNRAFDEAGGKDQFLTHCQKWLKGLCY